MPYGDSSESLATERLCQCCSCGACLCGHRLRWLTGCAGLSSTSLCSRCDFHCSCNHTYGTCACVRGPRSIGSPSHACFVAYLRLPQYACTHGSYNRVKGRSHVDTVEERTSMHSHRPHAPSQPALFSHTHSVTRRKHHRPGIAPNANKTHVPTAGSSAGPNETKPYSKPTLPRKRQTTPTNGHTPRLSTCNTSSSGPNGVSMRVAGVRHDSTSASASSKL